MTDDRTLYVGTDHALYRARPDDDGRWRAEGVALAGLGGIRGLVIDREDKRRWWACTADSGVLVTRDEGITWREANTGITTGAAGWCLARHPRTDELWYGAGPASMFRSEDGGDTWRPVTGIDALLDRPEWGPREPAHVRHIGFGAGGVVLAAVEEGWLLRSRDGGATWASVRDGLDRDCHAAAFLPGEPDAMVVTTGNGIYRSEDGGASFAPSSDGLRHRATTQVVVHPVHPDVVLTAAAECEPGAPAERPGGAGGAFYRSDDAGRSWWRLTGGLPEVMREAPTCVAGDPREPDAFYVGTTEGSIWLSEDGGESFRIAVEGIRGWVRHLLLTRP